jgi:hypothetical protein
MTQIEIQFFFPLTEQIPLELDFKPCQDYEEQKRQQMWVNSVSSVAAGQYLIAGNGIGATTWATINTNQTFAFKPAADAVGCWEINKDLQIWRKERPNALHQKMTKIFFGWEWKDK